MKKHLFCILFFYVLTCHSQNNIISQTSIDTLNFSKPSCNFLTKINNSLIQNKHLKGWTKYYALKSYCHLLKAENDSAIYYTSKAIKVYDSIEKGYQPADGTIHKAYYIKGLREYFDGKIMQSLQTLNKAQELTYKFPDSPDIVSWRDFISERIAVIHTKRGDYNLALKAMLESKKDSIRMKQRYEGGNTYADLGLLHSYLNNLDSTKYYYQKAVKIYNDSTLEIHSHYSMDSFNVNIVSVNNNLGDLCLQQKKIDSTIFYYKEGYNLLVKKGLEYKKNKRGSLIRFSSRANYAYVLMNQDSLKKSINILSSVKDTLDTFSKYDREERDLRLKVHEFLGQCYSKNKQDKLALGVEKELSNYLKIYAEEGISKQLQLYTIEYEVKEKDASILQLEENKTQQETIIKQQRYLGFGAGGLLIAFLVLGAILWRQRKLRNQYKLENLEQRLLRSQMNPHFVFNALNTVCSLVEKKSNQTLPYINKLATLFRLILTNSREEFVGLDDEILAIQNYLELQSNFSEKFDFEINIEEGVNVEEFIIPPMLIQPFVENAIFYGLKNTETKTKVTIVISRKEKGLLKFLILDNGVGYSNSVFIKKKSNTSYKSMSGDIVKERLSIFKKKFKVNSRFTIQNSLPIGTKVELYLPFFID